MSLKCFLTMIPPAPVTNKIKVEARGAVQNTSTDNKKVRLELLCNGQVIKAMSEVQISNGESAEINHTFSTVNLLGENKFELRVNEAGNMRSKLQKFTVVNAETRSAKLISGTWNGLYHWSEIEGKYWNQKLKMFTSEDWRAQIRGMHKLGMDIVVIQELFRNDAYYGDHKNSNGYLGFAYYPSKFGAGRVDIVCKDPLEVILDEASKLKMKVFPGVGLYAWFDFSKDSLNWHMEIAKELHEKYGHHHSFYGWYISEEIFGDLGNDPKREDEIVYFFQQINAFCKKITPTKPIMLAPNCHFVPQAVSGWKRLLSHLDILCPFGFHRMPEGDISGLEVAKLLQKLCNEAGTHLWMDMEAFDFEPDQALVPRAIEAIKKDLDLFTNFEKILCYQYQGLMTDPAEKITLGGAKAVQLFNDYKKYFSTHTGK